MVRYLLLLPLLLGLGVAAAGDQEAELQRLYKTLDLLKQEQQAVYQQFQMIQELGRGNAMALYGVKSNPLQAPGEIQNYNEVIDAQKRVIQRGEDLNRQAESLYARYAEIEEKKKPIQQRILELSTQK